MNIFALHSCPKKCAEFHNDKHVVKMILETAQIMCTVCHIHEIKQAYKPTHKHHPCVQWAGSSIDNYMWLGQLGIELGKEYTRRYEKHHKSIKVIKECINQKPDLLKIGLTPFAQAMPDQYKHKDAVKAYRRYYIGEKAHISTWKTRQPPFWFKKS